MKTEELVKKGIKRHTLRELEDKGMIKPKRVANKFSDNKTYAPREYSQEDLERIWAILLYQKMGLDNDTILKVLSGENIGIWDSMTEVIKQKESELEELIILLKFMRLVKAFGSLPIITETLGSNSFIEFMKQYINEIESKSGLYKIIKLAGSIADGVDNDTICETIFGKEDIDDEDTMVLLEDLMKDNPNFKADDVKRMHEIFKEIIELKDLGPTDKRIQSLIEELYIIYKNNSIDNDVGRLQFVELYFYITEQENDFGKLYAKYLGKEGVIFFRQALIQYLIEKCPEIAKEIQVNNIY